MEPHGFLKMDYKVGPCRRCGHPENHDAHTTSADIDRTEQVRIVSKIKQDMAESIGEDNVALLYLTHLIIDLEDGRVVL